MSKLIYVIQGTTGEYSDRADWIVCAFKDKEKATSFEQDLTDLSNKYFKSLEKLDLGYWIDFEELPAEVQIIYTDLILLDPKFQMDYTGTSYWVKEVELL